MLNEVNVHEHEFEACPGVTVNMSDSRRSQIRAPLSANHVDVPLMVRRLKRALGIWTCVGIDSAY